MTEVGNVYGESLYELAKEENLTQEIGSQLKVLQQSFRQEPDFLRLLASPNLAKTERCQILDDSFRGKLNPYLLNFLKILTEKNYVRHFNDCCDAFVSHYNQDNGILPVTAVTAVALKEAQAEKLAEKLGKITGKKIELHNRIFWVRSPFALTTMMQPLPLRRSSWWTAAVLPVQSLCGM